MQSTVQIELAVPAEIEEQNIVSVCPSEEPAQRAHRSVSGCLGQQRDVDIVEQPGLRVDERAVEHGNILDRPFELLQVVLVGRIGRVADQEGPVLAGHVCPPTRRAAAAAISRTLSTSMASPVSVTNRSAPSSSHRTSMRRLRSRPSQARKHSTVALNAPALPSATMSSSSVPFVPGTSRLR